MRCVPYPIRHHLRTMTSILFLLAIPYLAGGCWDLREIDQRAIVMALGIDEAETEKGVSVTVEIPIPGAFTTEGGTEGPPRRLLYASGATLSRALHNAHLSASRNLFYGHLRFVVISSEAAQGGLAPILNTLDRAQEVQRPTLITISEGKAREILEANIPAERLVGLYMSTFIEQGNRAHRAPNTALWRVKSLLARKDEGFTLPLLVAHEGGIAIAGLAIIREGKMVGSFNPAEMQGYMWLRGEVLEEVIVVSGSTDDIGLSIRTYNSNVIVEPHVKENRLALRVQMVTEATVAEYVPEHGFTVDSLKELEQRMAREIAALARHALERAQSLQVDIFGWGSQVKASLPHHWRQIDWPTVFPNLPVELDVRLHIRRTGGLV